MQTHYKTNVWYEKYRPQTVKDVILPPTMKDKILGYLENNGHKMPHLGLFSSTPGTGKSSLAKAILKDTKAEALWINASLDKGIDILRTKIQRFASQAPISDTIKIVVMDEFDHFSRDGQAAFRGFIDEFGNNVRFIFTGNYKSNIIDPLLDRLEIYDFNQFTKEEMVKPIYYRLTEILEKEGVQFVKSQVADIIRQEYPKIRKMIGLLGQYSKDGQLDYRGSLSSEVMTQLCALIKARKYDEMASLVYGQPQTDHFYGYLGQHLDQVVPLGQELGAVIVLARYQDMAMRVKDRHLNVVACCAELMKLN